MNAKKFGSWEDAVQWLIDQPDQQQLVRDCYYDQPLQGAAERYWKSQEWQAIRSLMPEGKGKALDIGAGQGVSSYALAKDGWDVVALEPDPSDLVGTGAINRLAEENGLQIRIACNAGEKIPCEDASFDFILARQVLHHANDLPQLCAEVFRVLKPGGVFIAVRDHVITSQEDLPKFLEIHPLHKLYGGEHAYQLREYVNAIQVAGFEITSLLRPFDSVINYAPYSLRTLAEEVENRLASFPGGHFLAHMITARAIFPLILMIMSRLDKRPGRLYSFVCRKK
jgi:SAM-dependent methyltransferase